MITPKLNLELPYDLVTLLPDTHSRELKTGTLNRCLYTPVPSSLNHNSQKQPKCPSVDGWISNLYMKYYLAFKKREILMHGCTLGAIVLSEMSQSEKDKQYVHLMKHAEWSESQRQTVGWPSPGLWGRVERGVFT